MELKEIRQLIKLVESADIDELEIVEDGKKLRISKSTMKNNGTVLLSQPFQTQALPPQPVPAHLPATVPGAEVSPVSAPEPASNVVEVRSPMVGTFYRSPAPDADPYIEIGQNVETGQILCIIEAMKLMNELESEYTGRITKILVENAQPVEYNQPLFLIDKQG